MDDKGVQLFKKSFNGALEYRERGSGKREQRFPSPIGDKNSPGTDSVSHPGSPSPFPQRTGWTGGGGGCGSRPQARAAAAPSGPRALRASRPAAGAAPAALAGCQWMRRHSQPRRADTHRCWSRERRPTFRSGGGLRSPAGGERSGLWALLPRRGAATAARPPALSRVAGQCGPRQEPA
ncbi:C-type natriuretic peptide-like [Ammospiza caudacuta]|uniref:C-type natriuretic peptide-like n=1 Tax=Ammospiza caudacuta TaxID=2857398 RepID=UPI002739867F|nr:C-type natriuretic peptide-like [Ammospiza caudacuta]